MSSGDCVRRSTCREGTRFCGTFSVDFVAAARPPGRGVEPGPLVFLGHHQGSRRPLRGPDAPGAGAVAARRPAAAPHRPRGPPHPQRVSSAQAWIWRGSHPAPNPSARGRGSGGARFRHPRVPAGVTLVLATRGRELDGGRPRPRRRADRRARAAPPALPRRRQALRLTKANVEAGGIKGASC